MYVCFCAWSKLEIHKDSLDQFVFDMYIWSLANEGIFCIFSYVQMENRAERVPHQVNTKPLYPKYQA